MSKLGHKFQVLDTIAAVGNSTAIAAATGVTLHITKVNIQLGSHSDTGTISLDDGTTAFVGPILCKDGNGAGYSFDFGEDGYRLTKGLGIRLVNGTANVSATVQIMGYKR